MTGIVLGLIVVGYVGLWWLGRRILNELATIRTRLEAACEGIGHCCTRADETHARVMASSVFTTKEGREMLRERLRARLGV